MSINKNLQAYQNLGINKEGFRAECMKTMEWSVATFYNKLSGGQPLRGLEEKQLTTLFNTYQKKQVKQLKKQLSTSQSPVLKAIKEKIL